MKNPADAETLFLNRDHVVSVRIRNNQITVMTADGKTINIPATESAISQFADDLANSVQSNFVSISYPPRRDRFVDEGRVMTIDPKKD
jgi:hypothetical protein